jgi:hypothetical protein
VVLLTAERILGVSIKFAKSRGHIVEGQDVAKGVQTIKPFVFLSHNKRSFRRAADATGVSRDETWHPDNIQAFLGQGQAI